MRVYRKKISTISQLDGFVQPGDVIGITSAEIFSPNTVDGVPVEGESDLADFDIYDFMLEVYPASNSDERIYQRLTASYYDGEEGAESYSINKFERFKLENGSFSKWVRVDQKTFDKILYNVVANNGDIVVIDSSSSSGFAIIQAPVVASVLKHSGVADSLPFWEAEVVEEEGVEPEGV